ncbi:amidohydrolase [Macrococcus equipercicus]|uniref:Amidohydrolase n=1 Tax=Macrococcus equipercicus TaxID=69967 RepID=A0A9Q9BP87_9STAP|nr:amidohydrolase [Macrococcus equipercicus]UTH14160.1 amidohydrolase [Macrococcus equipercicus]
MKIYYNGTIYTMDKEGRTVAAVGVEGNRIVALFEETPEIDGAEYIDLKSRVMFPGFIDTHIHLVGTGMALGGIDFRDDRSIDDVMKKIAVAAEALPEGSWLVCEGYDDNQLNHKLTRRELDAVTSHKVIVKRICRHAAIVNSAAFNALAISEDVADMEGGHFERQDGMLNGWVHDNAMELFVNASVHETEESLSRHMERAADAMHAVGLTAIHTEDLGYYNNFHNVFRAYQHTFGKGKKQLRLNLLRHTSIFEELMASDYTYDTWIKADSMKFYADGALGGRTALFREPYSDAPETSGLAIYTQQELEAEVQKARRYGATVAVHMIGDRACEMVLDAVEKYPPRSGRDRLIHVSFLAEDLIDRMAELPIICDVQPSFLTSDFPWAIERVGEERLTYAYAWQTLLNKGIIIGGGSDAPIESFNPLVGIDAAVNRRPFDAAVQYTMDEALSVFNAVRLYTELAATVAERPDNGLIKAGYLADFTILEADPFTINPFNIHQIKVAMTVVDGDIVYSTIY